MKVTACGGYVVVTYVPCVVVINVALVGFIQLVIGLLKFRILCVKRYKNSDRSRRKPSEFPLDSDRVRRGSTKIPTDFDGNSDGIWQKFAVIFFLQFFPGFFCAGLICPSTLPIFVRLPSEGLSDGHATSVGGCPTEHLISSERLSNHGYSDG